MKDFKTSLKQISNFAFGVFGIMVQSFELIVTAGQSKNKHPGVGLHNRFYDLLQIVEAIKERKCVTLPANRRCQGSDEFQAPAVYFFPTQMNTLCSLYF